MDPRHCKHTFDSPEFQRAYHCDDPLGAVTENGCTVFRLWAPTAQAVELRLYDNGTCGLPETVAALRRLDRGVWEYRPQRLLYGMYYDYRVTVDGQTYTTSDPWAKACGVNGNRSMVIDLGKTNPPGWEQDCSPGIRREQVIYELHIRDFSWDVRGGFDPADRGRYLALTRTGTTLNRDGLHPTGLDYLKKLGVTHIQLMPVYDYGSVDERNPESGYNWGYDPVNYNIPEGSYSSDPYRGEVRIRELKEMIAALHAQGFRVIMDVVYNHTYELKSNLFKTVPWYFYRQTGTGESSNGSGCGNDLASERSMCARYIYESALYWVEEYHMDGFRFDLMGLLDDKLMNRIQEELDRRYGPGEKLIYGEPWRAGDTHCRPGTVLCDKGNLGRIHPAIGAFSDDTRDAVKGSVMDAASLGAVNGGSLSAATWGNCVTAWTAPEGPARSPQQTVTYLSCHDDWTLWDKLVHTMDPEKRFDRSLPAVLRANRLAAAMYFTCQGRPFLLAGEEFGRTKDGIKNTYCSSARVNQLDWLRAWENEGLVRYYRGLIALRFQLPGLCDKSPQARRRLLWSNDSAPNCVVACVDNQSPGSRWDQLLLIFNCSDTPRQLNLPQGQWQLLVDHRSSFHWKDHILFTGSAAVDAQAPLILGRLPE